MEADTTVAAPPDFRALLDQIERYRATLLHQAANRCLAAGWTTIALFGDSDLTRRYIRQPWRWHGIRVAAVLDDEPDTASIDGVPVMRPRNFVSSPQSHSIEAVVVCHDQFEDACYRRAERTLEGRYPVLRIFGDLPPHYEPDTEPVIERLRNVGIAQADAEWLAANRAERHDASVDSLPISRTELHLRRYELARSFANGATCLDAASGTGYGSSLLAQAGAEHVTGIDIDPQSTDYASRYHQHPVVTFRTASALQTGLADESIDLVTSFETIEHLAQPPELIAEFARILKPGGTLVLSTPNEGDLSDYHEVSISRNDLDAMLAPQFDVTHRLGQIAANDPVCEGLPPGMFEEHGFAVRPDTLLAVATRR